MTPAEGRHVAPTPWTRRAFLGALAASGALAAVGCSDDDGSAPEGDDDRPTTTGAGDGPPGSIEVGDDGLPTEAAMVAWITAVCEQGIRRPGSEADRWTEQMCLDHFRTLGLEALREEELSAEVWDPGEWSLVVTWGDGEERELECFPVPFSAPADDLELDVVAWDVDRPDAVAGAASLYDVPLIELPATLLGTSGRVPEDMTGRIVDLDGTLATDTHVVPFGGEFQEVMEPSIGAGAAAFLGTLSGYPGDSCQYFVPYDGIGRPIPGAWVSGSDGDWIRERLAEGPIRIRYRATTSQTTVTTHNIVGELPGADDDVVMVASHHDAPWASAVEDGSGIAMVLAQATYWAARPVEERPHRMVFLLQGGHMSGGAGLHAYIEAHREELASVVLELHLEHAALEVDTAADGSVTVSDRATPRWWFTSRIPALEAAVATALADHELGRSMVMAPDAFGDQPPTDGAFYHSEGVPIVNFLAAPSYLFDAMDTIDKVDRGHLEAISRAAIDIIDSTAGTSAAEMRAGAV